MLRVFPRGLPILRNFHASLPKKMPMVNVVTNLPNDKVPSDFEFILTDILAESMNKPRGRIAVTVFPGSRLIHGGSPNPAVVISIRSIGAVGPEDNIRHTERVTKFCNESLGLPSDKVVIEYFNLTPETVGFNGTTVANGGH